jgi:hypothetical protein
MRIADGILFRKPERKMLLGEIDIDERIIKWVLRKQVVIRMWTGLFRFKIAPNN